MKILKRKYKTTSSLIENTKIPLCIAIDVGMRNGFSIPKATGKRAAARPSQALLGACSSRGEPGSHAGPPVCRCRTA